MAWLPTASCHYRENYRQGKASYSYAVWDGTANQAAKATWLIEDYTDVYPGLTYAAAEALVATFTDNKNATASANRTNASGGYEVRVEMHVVTFLGIEQYEPPESSDSGSGSGSSST